MPKRSRTTRARANRSPTTSSRPDAAPDGLFRALGNPTRLAIVARLSNGPAAVTELAEPFEMALPSFLQHLEVLEESGIVRSEKVGRVRTVHLRPNRLRVAEGWLAELRAEWNARLDRLDSYLQHMPEDDADDQGDR